MKHTRRHLIGMLALALVTKGVGAVVFAERPEVKQFVTELSQEYALDHSATMKLFAAVEPSPEVIQRITTPYEALPWDKYKKIFLNEKKISGGVEFWKKYKDVLTKAEATYGVPAELIVAIIGVESAYGDNNGKFPVLQALATLAFDYAPRATFFRSELKQYLLMTAEQGLDPLSLKGSYAGAMGFPQFIASSYRNYAVDFDNSGKIDIINNMPQAIGSVANYFKVHGWQQGQPVAYKISGPDKMQSKDSNAKLLEFDAENGKEYWEGLNNFYVITRYNHSNNYALAVYQLSQEIAKQYKKP